MTRWQAATASDVAKLAGVSRVTVSVVLNGARSTVRVSDTTRRRVFAAAAELGYTPNPAAQALRRQQSRIIGFVPRRVRRTPYEEPVTYLLGIHIAQAAMRRGYHVIEASAETTASRRGDELAQFLLSHRVDGVIFEVPDSEEEVQRFLDRGLPIVQIVRPRFSVLTSTITVDASPGITAAVDHLVDLGHRAIAFLGSQSPHPIDRARIDSFRAALARHHIDVGEDSIQLGDGYAIAEGYALTCALLSLRKPPTAILVAGDNLVLGTLRALHNGGFWVPDDVSVVSYDDTFAPHLYPPLTSVAQPLEEIAERATSLITDWINRSTEPTEEPTHDVFPSRLVVRESTGPPGHAAASVARRRDVGN